MFDTIVGHIESLKAFIIVTAVVAFGLGIILMYLCSVFSWEGKKRKVLYFFYGLDTLEAFGLACAIIKISLFLTILVTKCRTEVIYIYVYGVLEVFYIAQRRTFKRLPYHIMMGITSAGVLVMLNVLYSYISEVVFDKRVLVVMVMMDLLLIINGVTDLFRCANRIMEKDLDTGADNNEG